MMNLKRITWSGTSREDVKAFPDKVRKIVGSKLMTVQRSRQRQAETDQEVTP